MEKKNRIAFVYLVVGIAFLLGWPYIQNRIWPPPPKAEKATPEQLIGIALGTPVMVALDPEVDALNKTDEQRKKQLPDEYGALGGAPVAVAIRIDALALAAIERQKKAIKPAEPGTLIAMGHGKKPFHLQVYLNSRGGSVQQVVLTDFQQADREGLGVTNPDGSPKPLHLVPGVRVPRTDKIRDQREVPVPELSAGKIALDPKQVAQPSYVMYHYERVGDQLKPVDTLGNREWRLVRNELATDGNSQVVAFETDLGAPFYIRITKTFTLNRGDYHIGLVVSIVPHDRPAGAKVEAFRYQIDGPRGMPLEGEWYTSVHRQGVVGWPDKRILESPQAVWHASGSEIYPSADKQPILYAAIMIQYFASALAVDDNQAEGTNRDFLDYIRFTPEGEPVQVGPKAKELAQLNDLTFRAVTKPLDLSGPITHSYVLYQGPVKVRLLKQLEGDKAVPEETVNRYRDHDKLNLSSLTDAHMPNFIGRFANFIFWTDIVIFFTNLIHSVLFLLSHLIPNLASASS